MAKKDRKYRQEQAAATAEAPVQAVPAAEDPAPEKPVSSGLVLLFWGFIVALLFGTWGIESFTNVSEAKLERWLMLPLALFCVLILFLTRKKKSPDVPEV
ncbi:MAG: hypothetical protein FD189_2395 [Elusimicrobia bacterium]|nr:MAG: hypothetical protein FD154_2383 [Elusimicrobiota bacterium]KAF0153358.1 MAG: hypothetical protein FD189_2395 [Elusimicrobiota bacterium]